MKYLLNIFLIVLFFSACATANPVQTGARSEIKGIVKNAETTFVDVRIPEQFQERTAKNAVNIPLAKIEDNIEFFKGKENVVVFCNSGFQATKAMELLKKNGVQNVYNGMTLKNVEAIQNEK